jgi:hypothetical protein
LLKNFNSEKDSAYNQIINGISIIFILTAINAIFYSIGYAFSFKTGTYIMRGDYLADLYKISLSYPIARELFESGNLVFPNILSPLLDVYYKYTYQGIEGLSSNQLTHFHLPPLTTAFIFLQIIAFSVMGFLGATTLLLIATFSSIILVSKLAIKKDAYLFSLLIFISYPFIFLLQRGNFIAFFSFVLILLAVITLKKGGVFVPIVLIAIAVNFRPNLIVYASLLYFWPCRSIARPVLTVILALIIFTIALFFDNYIYPNYTLDNFIKGVKIYNLLYVSGDSGFGYSSSLFTLFKFIFKLISIEFVASYAINFQIAFTMTGLVYFAWLYAQEKIGEIVFVFLLTAISMLGTPIFADYHLLLFIIPAILVLWNRNEKDRNNKCQIKINNIIFITCCFMLSPLNYLNFEGLYVFSLLKTLTVFSVMIYLIYKQNGHVLRS